MNLAQKNINVVFTSAHAVKLVSECLKQKPDWKIYCIRNETRMAVEKCFGEELIVKYADNASVFGSRTDMRWN